MSASALFIGYSYGVASMVSYFHGEQNREKLKKLMQFSVWFILGAAALCAGVSIPAAAPLAAIFARPDSPVYELAVTEFLALLFVSYSPAECSRPCPTA